MIILLRHGETTFNRQRRWQGRQDSPLTDLGRSQAGEAAVVLAQVEIDRVVSSPLKRAFDTALVAVSSHGMTVDTDDRLMEVVSGVCEGLTHEEIEIRWPGFIAWRAEDRWRRAAEGGETYTEARERLSAFARDERLAERLHEQGKAVLIVGHSRSHAILAGLLLGWSDDQVINTFPANATPLVVRDGALFPL